MNKTILQSLLKFAKDTPEKVKKNDYSKRVMYKALHKTQLLWLSSANNFHPTTRKGENNKKNKRKKKAGLKSLRIFAGNQPLIQVKGEHDQKLRLFTEPR